ncbi:MAG: ATP-dependent DNA helicase RecQ [Verrucomicrobia bacterium]|nr:MAG: ATP-dependent DNA helicase RecQ [Verrucomicrobiota bacterium]
MQRAGLLALLKKTFGYSSFRPLQEEIISDVLAGLDVFALLPTGGGKSLCFQLPALAQEGLTLVVSPLIALMKDQVEGLQASGVAATFLNSTLSAEESRARFRGLYRGEYKLLYIAPERLMLPGFAERLPELNVRQVAIDEAHCISEWGHDFRPEYRQLAELRPHLPGVPFMALTATATQRVREDIVRLLALREPRCYTASFNRPNLTYRILAKEKPSEQVVRWVKERPEECGIVYCHSRKATESVAEKLRAGGISALPYHAGLDPAVRDKTQEKFLKDKVRVICATVAFGMGVHKPNVRFVLHFDLPKSIEGYYQETGRAGRDGLPGECVLLYSAADAIKQKTFIEEKADPDEQRIARDQLQKMIQYAESSECRRETLLAYFGETHLAVPCGGCDNCLEPRERFDGTVAAQKFLSCIFRLRQASNFGVGMNHLVEVLTGAASEKVKRWGHDRLTTYGIGKEHSRTEWQSIGRELMRMGLCQQTVERMSTLELAPEGLAWLKSRQPLTLTRPVRAATRTARPKIEGDIVCDETLFALLRALRREMADERNVPPYIIFADVTLRHMAARQPANEEEFAEIPGVGERKLRDFSGPFIEAIAKWRVQRSR